MCGLPGSSETKHAREREAVVQRPNYELRRGIAVTLVLTVLLTAAQLVRSVVGGAGDDSSASSSTTSSTLIEPVALVMPPACQVGETLTESRLVEDWQRSIVDTDRRLPADYLPPDLTSASAAGFAERFEVREFVIEDLSRLRIAAEENGTPIELIAAYRNVADQQDLFARRETELGFDDAAARTARPGHSEHHLGTAVDFRTAGEADVFQSWADEPAGRFMLANAHRFGFVASYPPNSQDLTCYDFEPWHYRYFGVDLATRIHDSGLSSREYLWHWQESGDEPVP